MSKVNLIKRFFESKPVQRVYKTACDPKNESFFNNTLPTIDTAVATSAYVWSTEKQDGIPREQKNVLQWQNVLSGVAGMVVGSYANKKITNVTNQVIPKLKPEIMQDAHKVVTGLKILMPCAMTSLIMRFALPTIIAQGSTMIEDYRRAKKKKLDIQA